MLAEATFNSTSLLRTARSYKSRGNIFSHAASTSLQRQLDVAHRFKRSDLVRKHISAASRRHHLWRPVSVTTEPSSAIGTDHTQHTGRPTKRTQPASTEHRRLSNLAWLPERHRLRRRSPACMGVNHQLAIRIEPVQYTHCHSQASTIRRSSS